jgi:4-amino-4-deoxy-L-arabinose transferase-like glycosyltransferase
MIGAFSFVLLLIVWFALDHSWPSWDAAEHMRIAGQYVPLLKHPRPWDGQWLVNFLSVNYFYPPAVYVTHGSLKALFGSGAWVNDLREVVFQALLCFSIYFSANSLFKSRAVGLCAVLFINAYPIVGYMSHSLMLDFPLLAMVSVALAALVYWDQSRTLKGSILLGVILGLCALTKQIGLLFLIGPGVFLFVASLRRGKRKEAGYLAIAAVIAAAMFLPWFVVNKEHMISLAHEIQHDVGNSGSNYFLISLSRYFQFVPATMTAPLMVLFFVSLISAGKENLQKTALLWLSAVVGMLLVCAIPYEPADARYLLPALVFPAGITASQVCRWVGTAKLPMRILGWTSIAGAVFTYIIMNFAPYPLPVNFDKQWITTEQPWKQGSSNFSPVPAGDLWGQEWAITTIDKHQKGNQCWLNILPSNPHLSVHTFEAVISDIGAPISVSSFRGWSASGDSFDYSPEQFGYYNWFLLKSGDQGFKLRDDASRRKYAETVDFIRKNLTLVGTRSLPDGSELSLYSKN